MLMRLKVVLFSIVLIFLFIFLTVHAEHYYSISSGQQFDSVSVKGPEGESYLRETKFLAPVDDSMPIPRAVFQDANEYMWHHDFLTGEFPELYASLTLNDFYAITSYRKTRQYFAGALYKIDDPKKGIIYGFNVYTAPKIEEELLTQNEVAVVYMMLKEGFTAGELYYFPRTQGEVAKANEWLASGTQLNFKIHIPEEQSDYIVYSRSVNYGFVRVFRSMDSFHSAFSRGEISWQDIVILPEAPFDIETVIAGAITAERQSSLLNHLNVRSMMRGTPNAFYRRALDFFTPYDSRLVRLDLSSGSQPAVREALLEEANSWWKSHRPNLAGSFSEAVVDDFEIKDVRDAEPDILKYGGKGANLIQLYRILPEEYQVKAMVIPFAYYEQIIQDNFIVDSHGIAGPPGLSLTLSEYIEAMTLNNGFWSNLQFRNKVLSRLRDDGFNKKIITSYMTETIRDRIVEVFGDDETMVRFRSSSNIEDALEFSGAGLYHSESACPYDSFDNNDDPPSMCDPCVIPVRNGNTLIRVDYAPGCTPSDLLYLDEKTIKDSMSDVLKSVWNQKAFDERAYFQIPQPLAKMAILVTKAFPDEDSNGVIFTGNPMDSSDNRYLVNVQLGDESVVNPDPTVMAEADWLTTEGGRVTRIDRERHSTLSPERYILSDEQLKEMGRVVADVDARFPKTQDKYPRERVIFDLEFKFQDGQLKLKQIRPFLRPEKEFNRLVIPEGTSTFGVWAEFRTLKDEFEVKSRIEFVPGLYSLQKSINHFDLDIIDKLRIGPMGTEAAESGPGKVTVDVTTIGNRKIYDYTYLQDFTHEGRPFTLTIRFSFVNPTYDEIILDDSTLSDESRIVMTGSFPGLKDSLGNDLYAFYSGSTYENYKLQKITFRAQTGEEAELLFRVNPQQGLLSGVAQVMQGTISKGTKKETVTDYFSLAYSADKHNEGQRFLVMLKQPMDDIHGISLYQPHGEWYNSGLLDRAQVVDRNLKSVRTLVALEFKNEEVISFLRGDVDADGRYTLGDAVLLLNYLFTEGGKMPSCLDAADVDDDGVLTLGDAVRLLNYLFIPGSRSPAVPYESADIDPTDDSLECKSYGG